MISEFEKHIYNLHLKATKDHNKSPYKFRKDFSNISDTDQLTLNKLSSFFFKHKNISPEIFFKSAYKLYSDEKFLPLSFFNTLKAIKAYTIFQKNLNSLDPDSAEQLEFTKKSLIFVFNFCKLNKINFYQYPLHSIDNFPSFLLHLKERHVNIFSLFYFDNIIQLITRIDNNRLKFMFDDEFLANLNAKKIKYLNSKKCKFLVINGINRLIKKLEKS